MNKRTMVNELELHHLNKASRTLHEYGSTSRERIQLNAIAEKHGYVFDSTSDCYVPDERPVVGPMHRESKQIINNQSN